MKNIWFLVLTLSFASQAYTQTFTRSVLNVDYEMPWEIQYGPDNFLWITDQGGKVFRVHPESGESTQVFTAPDFFAGSADEKASCGRDIGNHTYGLALHPDFLESDSAYIYFIYSYNSGTENIPVTLFKIVRLKWDSESNSVLSSEDVVTELANGYDHWGGRMMAIKQNGVNYIYYSTGDTGANDESCYNSLADNPNNFTQDPNTKMGKIHRVNMDGSIPSTNPIPGNTFFTRGHRNPQGLAYNPNMDVLYDIEHGHTIDDEINVLEAGMNYGWKNISGYHDGNIPDELSFVENYSPHPDIPNDQLREPLFSWGAVEDKGGNFLTWPTVAPSDGVYYGSDAIPQWTNSLLVVTLKDGSTTDREVFQFKLNPDGKTLVESTDENPNPKKYFGEDQDMNDRLRDIAISPDGKKIFLLRNAWSNKNPIVVYTLNESTPTQIIENPNFDVSDNYPNPFEMSTSIRTSIKITGHLRIEIYNSLGHLVKILHDLKMQPGEHTITWNGNNSQGIHLSAGIYYYNVHFDESMKSGKMILLK